VYRTRPVVPSAESRVRSTIGRLCSGERAAFGVGLPLEDPKAFPKRGGLSWASVPRASAMRWRAYPLHRRGSVLEAVSYIPAARGFTGREVAGSSSPSTNWARPSPNEKLSLLISTIDTTTSEGLMPHARSSSSQRFLYKHGTVRRIEKGLQLGPGAALDEVESK
jgi:hypothetical protein